MATSHPNLKVNAKPVYLDYGSFRSAVHTTDRQQEKMGKIYVYQDLLLINEPNKGIHLFDNQDPRHPEKITFIHIPGNVDMAVYQGFLYADSFIDLVVLDIRSPSDIKIVHRLENKFKWDAYQAIPDQIRFFHYEIDQTKGVIIDYENI